MKTFLKHRSTLLILPLLILLVLPFLSNFQVNPYREQTDISQLPSLPDSQYALSGGTSIEDYIDSQTDVDSHADHGTHDVFNELKATDNAMDTMTEANTNAAQIMGANAGSGTAYRSIAADAARGTYATAPISGTVGTVTAYLAATPSTSNAKAFITSSTDYILANGISGAVAVTTTAQDYTFTFSTPPSVTASTEYHIYIIVETSYILLYRYDTENGISYWDALTDYHAPNDPTDRSAATDLYRRLYATITPSVLNYELDLEGQFTDVDYSQPNEYLCIKASIFDAGGEALKVDVWTGAAWTNVIASLTLTIWNNVSVAAYLTSDTFTIRFLDGTKASDTSQGSWHIDSALLHVWVSNAAPVNVQAPTCVDVDDTNNIYSMYKYYSIVAHVSDADGYADIEYIWISLYNDARSTYYWTLKYTEDDNTFSELVDDNNYVDMSGSSATRSGNTIDASFDIRAHFNHPAVTADDFRVAVHDVSDAGDDDYFETNWDWVPTLEYDTTPTVTSDDAAQADRGDLNENFHITGDISYEGSTLTPPSSAIDIWVSATHYGSNVGPWETDTLNADGTFTCETYADDVVGQDTYTVKVVAEAGGSAGTDLITGADPTDTYIADRAIQSTTFQAVNGRVDISSNCLVYVQFKLEYDNHAFTSGDTVTLATYGVMTWDAGDARFEYTRSESTVTADTFDITSVSEVTYGITSFVDPSNVDVIWDQTRVVSYTIVTPSGDSRVNITDTVTYDVELHFDYDESDVATGTVTVNGHNAVYQSAGKWRFTDSEASVTSVLYNNMQSSGNAHAITVEDNTVTLTEIWDRTYVVSLTYTGTPDTRIPIGTSINYDWELHFDYDEADVTTGTVTINGYACSYTGANGIWRYTNASSAVGSLVLNQIATSGNAYGITSVYMNGKSVTMIYDRDQVKWIVANATYFELSGYALLTVGLEYDYDNAAITAGTFSLRYGTTYLTLTHLTGGNWTTTDSSAGATSRVYNYVNGTATLYGINVVDNNGKTKSCHWDKILLTVTVNKHWTVEGYNVTASVTGTYQGLGWKWNGTATFNSTWTTPFYPSRSVYGNYSYVVTSITNTDTPLVGFSANTVYCVWDDAAISSVAYCWTQYSPEAVWMIWMSGTWTWEFNGTTLDTGADVYCIVQSHMNGTEDDWAIVSTTGDIGDLIIGEFNPTWYYMTLAINVETTIDGVPFDWTVWTIVIPVDILHSLQIVSFAIVPTDDYFWIQFQTSIMNASITIWDDGVDSGTLFADNIYHSDFEGMHQIPRSDVITAHNVTVCITSTGTEYDRDYTVGDYVWWYNFTYVVSPSIFTAYIRVFDSLGDFVPFETFLIYRNNTRQYTDAFTSYSNKAYQIQVKDRFGATLNTTTFAPGTEELVLVVNIHSLKVQSWHHDYVFFNLTRSGITYREVIAPLEIVPFRLYQNTYTWLVDYRNGTTVSGSTNLTTSTAIVITGNTITDLAGYSQQLLSLTTQINVTITTTQNQVVTISLDLTNMNSTIYNQTIDILLNVANSNSTIYSQTLSILAQLSNVNTTLYTQTVSILAAIQNVNTTLYAQTVTLLADVQNINSTLYAQTLTILTQIQNANMTLYNQTVSVLTYILNTNSTLYAQTITLLTEVDTIEEQAEVIEDVARQIYGDLPADPEPTKNVTDTIWELVLKILVGGFIILILAIVLSTVIRALLNDRRLKAPDGNQANAKTSPTVFLG